MFIQRRSDTYTVGLETPQRHGTSFLAQLGLKDTLLSEKSLFFRMRNTIHVQRTRTHILSMNVCECKFLEKGVQGSTPIDNS